MFGVIIQKDRNLAFIYLSGTLSLLSICLLVWAGPPYVWGVSAGGLLLSLGGALLSRIRPDRFASSVLHLVFGGSHVLWLLIAWGVYFSFLTPLSEANQKIPRLNRLYTDPRGLFEVKGPWGWDYGMVQNADQIGVIMSPPDRRFYIGANELRVYVMRLPKRPDNPVEFLKKFEFSLSQARRGGKQKKLFLSKSEPAQLLRGGYAVWSELTVSPQAAFQWISMTQTTLIGIKNGEFVCTISAAGPTPHSGLFRVMCLGLFEKIKINSALFEKNLQNDFF